MSVDVKFSTEDKTVGVVEVDEEKIESLDEAKIDPTILRNALDIADKLGTEDFNFYMLPDVPSEGVNSVLISDSENPETGILVCGKTAH